MRKLGGTCSQMKLWGKIKCTERDYYVTEGVVDAGEEQEQDPNAEPSEPRGTGVNKYAYFVCNSPNEEWKILPDLKPSDIRNARGIKHTFSGDLEREIFTNPFYFQKEKVYLRAQIARITASTTLTPAGLYEFEEESTRDIKLREGDDENPIKVPTVNDMRDLSKWLHLNPSILNQGRTKHIEGKPLDPEEEPEVTAAREVAKDPWDARLKPLNLDERTRGGIPAWLVRAYDADSSYEDPKTKGPTNYGTVVVRSLWWPGSFTFYNNGRTQ